MDRSTRFLTMAAAQLKWSSASRPSRGRPRRGVRAAGLLLLVSVVVSITGCTAGGSDSGAAAAASSPPTTAPTASGLPAASACDVVVAAIRYAELYIVPPGQELLQDFTELRGRVAYVEGVIEQHGESLPTGARPLALQLAADAAALDDRTLDQEQLADLLRDYRVSSEAVVRACEPTPAGASTASL
jgi:hypothetical protein